MPVSTQRIFGLDLLRAFAILTVVYGHGNYLLRNEFDKAVLDYFTFDGVTIFFVLSGFLIGGIIIKQIETGRTEWSDLFRFWKRRWLRTLPNYFLILSLLTVFYVKVQNVPFERMLPYFGFVQNLSWPHPPYFNEAWSLAVEEWFYLAIPLLIWLTFKFLKLSARKTLFTVAIIVLAASAIIRIWRFADGSIVDVHSWDLLLRKQVVTRLDSIMFGIVAAYIKFYKQDWWYYRQKMWLILGISLLLLHKVMIATMISSNVADGLDSIASFWVISLGTVLMLPYLASWKTSRTKMARAIEKISLISYSMYLIHRSGVQWILVIFTGLADYSTSMGYIGYWLFTFIIAGLIYKYFEKPTTALRDRF